MSNKPEEEKKGQPIRGRQSNRNYGRFAINKGALTPVKDSLLMLVRDSKAKTLHGVKPSELKPGDKVEGVSVLVQTAPIDGTDKKPQTFRVSAFNQGDMNLLKAYAEKGQPIRHLLEVSHGINKSDNPQYAGKSQINYQLGPSASALVDGNRLKYGTKEIPPNEFGDEPQIAPVTQAYMSGVVTKNSMRKPDAEHDYYIMTMMCKGFPATIFLNKEDVEVTPSIKKIFDEGKSVMMSMVADVYFKRMDDAPGMGESEGADGKQRFTSDLVVRVSGRPLALYETYAKSTADDSMIPVKDQDIEESQEMAGPSM